MLVRTIIDQRIRRYIPIRTVILLVFFLIPLIELAIRPNGILLAVTVGIVIGLLHLLADLIAKWADIHCPTCNRSVAALASYTGLRGLQNLEYCPKCGVSVDCHIEDVATECDFPETVDHGLPARVAWMNRGIWLMCIAGLACLGLSAWAGFPPAVGLSGWILIVLTAFSGLFVQASVHCPGCRQNLGWLLSGSLTRTLRATARYCPFCRCNLVESNSDILCESNVAGRETEA